MRAIKCYKCKSIMDWKENGIPEKEGYYCRKCGATELEKDRKQLNDDGQTDWVDSQISRAVMYDPE